MTVPHTEVKYTDFTGTHIQEIRPSAVYYSQAHAKWRIECWDIEKQDWRTYNLADCDFTMQGSLETAFNAVKEFHIAFGHPVHDRPSPQAAWEHNNERRAEWIKEEVEELNQASDITEVADAYIDIIYFALGGLVEIGIEPSKIFDIVQSANMAKLWPDGKPRFREDGKIIKPDGWESPDDKIAAYIKGLSE